MATRFLCMVVLSCSLVVFCTKTAEDFPKKKTSHGKVSLSVIATTILQDTIVLPIVIPGKLAASSELKLSFLTGGYIQSIEVKEGAAVKKGSRIALLDTTQFITHRNKALIALDKARRDLMRVEKLFSDSVATLEQLQNAQSASDLANADLALANFNLTHATLVAPSDGKILKRLAQSNEIVGPGMPVFLFGSTEGQWTIKASVADKDVLLITPGDSVHLSFDAIPEEIFAASVIRIGQVAHPVTGTFEVEINVTKSHTGFRSGMIADVKIYPRKQSRLMFIPVTALVSANGNKGMIWAIGEKDAIFPVTVTIYRLYHNLAAISSGLEHVNEIISIGAANIQSGTENIIITRNSGAQ